jgi:hypothetical protein
MRKLNLKRPALLMFAGIVGTSAVGLAIAQEPRLRLRNVPQRLYQRLRPDAAKPTPSDAESKDKSDAAKSDEAKTDTPGSLASGPVAPADGSVDPIISNAAEALKASISANSLQSSSLQKPDTSAMFAAPSEQPLVVATEAEKNQAIAQDWPKPWACLFITGRQYGYIEPCGCTGLENQKGGLNRRDTLLTNLRDRGWTVLPVDAGDQVRRAGVQSEIKFAQTVKALNEMQYAAVGFGPEELKLSPTELMLQMLSPKGEAQSIFVSANIAVLQPDTPERYKVITLPNNRRIGITSVLGDDYAKKIPVGGDIIIEEAVTALQPIAEQLAKDKLDYRVLIVNASLEETRRIAQAVPSFNLVVTAGGHGEPLYKPEPVPGTDAIMIQVGVKGMYTGILGLYDDQKNPFRYQRIALSSQFEDSPRIMKQFEEYQNVLQKKGFDKLGVKPLTHPTTRDFVGSKTCGDCHTTAFKVWEDSPHFHATESIVQPPSRGDIARHFDPECVSCHVTGWNAQGFFPYKTGYVSLEKSPDLTGNGCENCHGPGSQHVAYENGELGDDPQLAQKLRDEMKLPLDKAQDKCLECHDLDNSPSFHKDGAFEEYWQQIVHEGKD